MFKVNQKVVCIDANFDAVAKLYYTALPEQDKVYVIREVIDGGDWRYEPTLAVFLVGLVNPCSNKPPFYERGFAARRFRLLDTLPPKEESSYKDKVIAGVGFGEGRDTSEDWKTAAQK